MKRTFTLSLLMTLFMFSQAQLSGNYTIDAGSPASATNYQNFSSAVSDLVSGTRSDGGTANGPAVSGAVLFSVVSGSGPYNEQLTIGSITGASVVNTITFRGGTAMDTISYAGTSSSNSHTIKLNGADYITFDSLSILNTGFTYAIPVLLSSASDFNTISNCIISMPSSTSSYSAGIAASSTGYPYSTGNNANNTTIVNNQITGGYYGVRLNGTSSSTQCLNNTISGNYISVYYYGIYSYYQKVIEINNNEIYFDPLSTSSSYGLYTYYNDVQEINGNRIENPGRYGMYINRSNSAGVATDTSDITNNMIGGGFRYTSTSYGVYLYYCEETDFLHNTVYYDGPGSTTRGIYNYYGSDNDIRNNIFVNTQTNGQALGSYNSTGTVVDYNAYWAPNSTNLIYYNGTNYTSANFVGGGGVNNNSLLVDPVFVNAPTDLHINQDINLYDAGANAGITSDYDGDSRPLAPSTGYDIGADEFFIPPLDAGITSIDSPAVPACVIGSSVYATIFNYGIDTIDSVEVHWSINGATQPMMTFWGNIPSGSDTMLMIGTGTFSAWDTIAVWTANPNGTAESGATMANDTAVIILAPGMSGSYAIGGVGADYYSYSDALNDLYTYGICGPVEFLVNDSTYNEQLVLTELQGMSAVSTVTFRSASGDSSLSVLTYSSTSSTENYTILFDGADYFRFRNLTISNDGSSYATVLNFGNAAMNNMVSNSIIRGDTTPFSTSTYLALIYSNNSQDNGNEFHQNMLDGGSYGAYFYGQSTSMLESGTVFSGNHFMRQYYYGVRLYYQDAVTFDHNTIEMPGTYTGSNYGAYFGYCDNANQIFNNKITNTNEDGYGIYLYYCDAALMSESMVYNNMIQFGSTGTSYGIRTYYGSYQNIMFNSVNVTSPGGYGLYMYYGDGHNIHNNNIVTTGTSGYGMYSSFTTSNVSTSDHNNIYSPSATLIYWDGPAYNTIAAFSGATGLDSNSVSVDPMYYSSTDLHACNDTLAGAGMEISGIGFDFDGDVRNTPPAIGADEVISTASFTLGPDPNKCPADSVMIGYGITGASYTWNTGDSTDFIWVNTPGTYYVDVTTGCGVLTDTIDVINDPLPVAGFGQNLSFLTASFVNSSSDATSYSWDFGDGGTSTNPDPVHVYAQDGIYYVCLVATNSCDADTLCDSVAVCVPIGAAFNYSIGSGGLDFNFTDMSNGTPVSWNWDFGDGSNDNVQNPSHTYASPGSYTITLIIENICGDRDTLSQQLVVTGTEELTENTISMYPNPAQGQVMIELGSVRPEVRVAITDLSGKVLFVTEQQHTAEIQISLDQFVAGMYLVRISSGKEQWIERLVIE